MPDGGRRASISLGDGSLMELGADEIGCRCVACVANKSKLLSPLLVELVLLVLSRLPRCRSSCSELNFFRLKSGFAVHGGGS